ncbi:MAG: diadenylate cyclase CdaA [Spirochaetaceae bacterium]|nr:diadenylate cyclase CdaA [Spirochaetaceae bacterium]
MDLFSTLIGIYSKFFSPFLDIAILAFLIYKAYRLLAKTQAVQLIKGAGFLALIYGFAYIFKLTTLLWILKFLTPGLFIAIALIFQPELRKIIIKLGLTEIFSPGNKPRTGQLEAVVTAAEILSELRRGMLIVFPRRSNINRIIEGGTRINGEISSTLIVTVFQFDGPLHDAAMVIRNGKIAAAGCVLPLSEQQEIRKSFGTRHRAALGMSEESDAVMLIVSEETGAISIAFDSQIYYDLSSNEVLQKLRSLLDGSLTVENKTTEEERIDGAEGAEGAAKGQAAASEEASGES